jgi:hypothetical protein
MEWLIHRESQDQGRGIHGRNGYSTGNYQLMNEEATA